MKTKTSKIENPTVATEIKTVIMETVAKKTKKVKAENPTTEMPTTEKKVKEKKPKIENPIAEEIYTYASIKEGESKEDYRRKIRDSKLKGFVSRIINFGELQKDEKLLKENIAKFKEFYAIEYKVNDFERYSLCTKSLSAAKQHDIDRMLGIIKNN